MLDYIERDFRKALDDFESHLKEREKAMSHYDIMNLEFIYDDLCEILCTLKHFDKLDKEDNNG